MMVDGVLLPMKNITDPRDVDVLCGRGGAALRHPGNQTYRRLVNLNKGLYITCLKTEKLKISRSIVAAIREQKGRFLERDGNEGTWYDIGDKKAIEKTSQALREGQPKLRQKIVELGGAPPGAVSLEQQLGNGMYNAHANMTHQAMNAASMYGDPYAAAAGMQQQMQQMQATLSQQGMHQPQHMMSDMMQQQQMMAQMQQQQQHFEQQHAMPPPQSRVMNQQQQYQQQLNQQQDHMVHEMMLKKMSLGAPPPPVLSPVIERPSPQLSLHRHQMQQQQLQQQRQATQQHPGIDEGADINVGQDELHHSNMQQSAQLQQGQQQQHHTPLDYNESAQGMGRGDFEQKEAHSNNNEKKDNQVSKASHQGFPFEGAAKRSSEVGEFLATKASSSAEAAHNNNNSEMKSPPHQATDRRQLFAKMKFSRRPSGGLPGRSEHSGSSNDDMLDIYMVESNISSLSISKDSDHKMIDPLGLSDHKMKIDPLGLSDHKMRDPLSRSGHRRRDPLSRSGHRDPLSRSSHRDPLSRSGHRMRNSDHRMRDPLSRSDHRMKDALASYSDHQRRGDELGLGSRRSLMSGLSKISDTSDVNSIFSDLSRKIGNVSTRSIAMSEISGIDIDAHQSDCDNSFSMPPGFEG